MDNAVTQNTQSILIIEDDDFLSDAYQIKFEQGGCKPQIAKDGESGLEMAKTNKPNIIILDLMLPKMSGMDVLKALKADPELQNIPVMIASNYSDEEHKQQAKQLGAVDFFVKSQVSIPDLIEECRRHVAASS